MKTQWLVFVVLLIGLLILPGCLYPASQSLMGRIDDPPDRVREFFAEKVPEAEQIEYFESYMRVNGLIDYDTNRSYDARFKMNGTWYVAWFDGRGRFTGMRTDEGSLDRMFGPPEETEER